MHVDRPRAAMDADPVHAIVRDQTAGRRAAINADRRMLVQRASARARRHASRNLPINRQRGQRLSLRHRRPSVRGVKHKLPRQRRQQRQCPQRLQLSLQSRPTTTRPQIQKLKTRARVRAVAVAVVAAAAVATRTRSTHHKQPYPMKRSCLTSTTKMQIAAPRARRTHNRLLPRFRLRFLQRPQRQRR